MTNPIARGTIRTSLVLGLRLLVQAGTLLIVARMLGPHQFGAFTGIAALAVILGTLSTFGIHLVLLGEVSREPARREQVLPYAVPSTLLNGAALFGIYLLVYTLVLGEANIPSTALVSIGIAEIVLQPLLGLQAVEHMGLERIARSQLLGTLPLILRLLAAAAVFLINPVNPLAAYAYGYLIASVLALVIATPLMPAPWPTFANWRLPNKTELRLAAGYAALSVTATSPAELDKTLAAKLLPLSVAGVYAAGARVIGATTLPVMAMMLSALPRLFREGQDQPERTRRLLRWIFGAALVYSIVLVVALWTMAPLLYWIFGASYHDLGNMIRWLCIVVPGMALRMAAGSVLMALGRPWMRFGFEIAGLVILVIAADILTAHFGELGMALALTCSEWGMAAIGAALILRAKAAWLTSQVA